MPCSVRIRSEEHTSELQSPCNLVCRVLFRSDRKSTRLNSSHLVISYAVFCLKKEQAQEAADGGCSGAHAEGHRSQPAARVKHGRGRWPRVGRFGFLFLLGLSFFFNDTATTEIYTLSLHDALPIYFNWWDPAWPAGMEKSLNPGVEVDRKSTRLNSSHLVISYAVFCLKKTYSNLDLSSCFQPRFSTKPRRSQQNST